MREYNVIVKKGVDLRELEEELISAFGSETVPEREVEIADPRELSQRITTFILDDDEAARLRLDPRIEDVEIPPLQQEGMVIGRNTVNVQSGDFLRASFGNSNTNVNWGLRRSIETTNIYNGSTTVTGDYTYSRDGTGVDIVIMDSGIQADHPDFEDADGNSRVRQIDWYDAAGVAGTMPANFYTDYEGHGTHCASIAAGKTYGWAKNADIYAMKLRFLEGPADPGVGISIGSAFDLIRLWHLRKNDPADPIYTGRPTVVNASFGYSGQYGSNPSSGEYRGAAWTYGDPGRSTPAELAANVGIVDPSIRGFYQVSGANSTTDAEVQDMNDDGIVTTISAGNNLDKYTLSGDVEFDNFAVFGTATRYYHRKSSPWSADSFYVGNVDEDQSFQDSIWKDRVDYSSSRGPAVNIWAPGRYIMAATSSTTNGYTEYEYPPNPSYNLASIGGTSMAAPQIAGIAALHLQANRGMSISQIKDRLIVEDSANVMYTTGSDTDYDNYTLSLLGSAGNVVYSRYYQDVAEPLSNITLSNSNQNIGLNGSFTLDVRDLTSNVTATNLRSITITTPPANGNVTITDTVLGTMEYVPTVNYSGTDSFEFTVENQLGNVSTTSTVDIDIASSSGITFTTDDFVELQYTGEVINVLANDDVANANVASVTIVTGPSNGTVVAYANGNVLYTPDVNFYGKDSFTYTVAGLDAIPSDVTNVSVAVQQTVAINTLTANADSSNGTTTINVLESTSSYDPYFANVVGLYNFKSGLTNSVGTMGTIVPSNGQISRQTNEGKHDFTSLYVSGPRADHTGANIDTSSVSNFFTGDEWTIEFDFKYNQTTAQSGSRHIMGGDGAGPYDFRIFMDTSSPYNITFMLSKLSGTTPLTLVAIPYNLDQWNTIAVQRKGDNLQAFVNGILVKDDTEIWGGIDDIGNTLTLGHWSSGTNTSIEDLYLDNIRFTKDHARYNNDYTVPNQGYPTDNTELANVSTLTIVKQPSSGSAVIDGDSNIAYTPTPGFVGTDYIEYNITSVNPTTSANANLELSVTASVVATYDEMLVSPNSLDEDGSTVTFTVNSTAVTSGANVGYTISGSGITVDDISLSSLTGNITMLSNVGVLSFDVLADNLTEGFETLIVTLAASDSEGTLTGSLSNILVINDTSVSPASYDSATFNRLTADEDADDFFNPTLVRFNVVTTNVDDGTTVSYVISGTGITVDDITLSSLTGTITINSNTGSVEFYVEEDNLTEGNETLILTLSATDSAGTPTGSLSDSIILNDTSVTPGEYLDVFFDAASVDEGNSVLFTVDGNNIIDGTTVGYTISGTNVTLSDISLISLTGSIEINSNTGTLSFDINQDSFTEGPETLFITLDATDSTGASTSSLANSIIINDTSTTPANGVGAYNSVQFDLVEVDEDNTTVNFTINTSNVAFGTFVGYTISGAGITVDDISLASLTGNIGIYGGAPAAGVGTVTFQVLPDYTTEGDEVLTITLDPADEAGNPTNNLSASITIVDTSLTPAYNSVVFDVASITENDFDVATFIVNTENVLDGTSVGYTITGTTVDDISLASLTGNITINSDTGSLSFTAVQDNITDGDQTVFVTLGAVDSFGTATGNLVAMVDILDTSTTPVNPPTANTIVGTTTNQRTSVSIDISNDVSDTDGIIQAINIVPGTPSNGSVTTNLVAGMPPPVANIVYTPDSEFYGLDLIQYTVTDSDGAVSNTANIQVEVYQSPVTVNDAANVDENTSIIVSVLSNDIQGTFPIDTATVTVTSGPSNGNIIILGNGSIQYTPTIGYFGNDNVTYTVEDVVGGLSLPATVNFNVIENVIVPPLPPIAVDDFAFCSINSSTLINVVANDFDDDNSVSIDTVVITAVPADGNVQQYANGYVLYTPTEGFSGIDSFKYTVNDVTGLTSNEANVTVEVLAAPIAINDNAIVQKNFTVNIFVPGNDIETDGNIDVSSVVIVDAPLHGVTELETDGNISYTPDFNFVGEDSFTYSIADENEITSGPATVTITVQDSPAEPKDLQLILRNDLLVGQPVTTPVNHVNQIVPKFAPELRNRITNNNEIPISYFYDNPKLAYSFTKTPQQKIIGYDPSTYPSTAEEDRIPISWSDFIGYLWYFVPFPDPAISVSNFRNLTAYTNTGPVQVSATYSIDYFPENWPVPPRPTPTKKRVTIQWYKSDPAGSGFVAWGTAQIITSGSGLGSGTTRSPAYDTNTSPRDLDVLVSIKAELIGPNDDDPLDIINSQDKVYAAKQQDTTRRFEIIVFVPIAPGLSMNPLRRNSARINITRRTIDNAVVGYSADRIDFVNQLPGAEYTFPPAPGRSPVDVAYSVWEVQNPDTGAWQDLPFGDVSKLDWPQAYPYDGVDGNPDYNDWAVRLKAQARQNLNNPTAQNYSALLTTANQAQNYQKTVLQFVTDYKTSVYTAEVRFPCLKGIDLAGRFDARYVDDGVTYYWRIETDGAHANEFSPTQGSFTLDSGTDEQRIYRGINPTCSFGSTQDLPYFLRVYADSGRTQLLAEDPFTTIYREPTFEFYNIYYIDRFGDASPGPVVINTNDIITTREGAQATLRVRGYNVPKDESDYYWIEYNRTVSDTTTPNDLQYRLPGQGSFTTVNEGDRIPVAITSAGLGSATDDYVTDGIVFLKFVDDSPAGGEEDNYEQFSLGLFEAQTGGSADDAFRLRVYDNYEYFLGIVDTLEVSNPTYTTLNGTLTQPGSGYIKWTGATLGQSYGTFNGFSVYDPSTWGSAIANPGPEYEDRNFGGLYQWQYWTGSTWAQLGDVYVPGNTPERNVNGDARLVQREDDYFEFKNIDSQVIGGINWANGVTVRAKYTTYYNFVSISNPGVAIGSVYSNQVTLKIEVNARNESLGLTSVRVYGNQEPGGSYLDSFREGFGIKLSSSGMIGQTVTVEFTDKGKFFTSFIPIGPIVSYPPVPTMEFTITDDYMEVDNGAIFTQYWSHLDTGPNKEFETVTARLNDPSAAQYGGEDTVVRDFTITNSVAQRYAGNWWRNDDQQLGGYNGNQFVFTYEGERVGISWKIRNWPGQTQSFSEFNLPNYIGMEYYIANPKVDGVAITDAEVDDWLDIGMLTSPATGVPYLGSGYSTKRGGWVSVTDEGFTPTTLQQRQSYDYFFKIMIQSKLREDTASNFTFDLVIYPRIEGTSTQSILTSQTIPLPGGDDAAGLKVTVPMTIRSTVPEPWDPADGEIQFVGTTNWYEDGLKNDGTLQNITIPYHAVRWATAKNANDEVTAPVGTPVYYRLRDDLSTAVEGVDFNSVNPGPFATKANGSIHQPTSLRTDGVPATGVLFELIDDGIAVEDEDKTIVFEMSFFSDFRNAVQGSAVILDRYDPPQVPPVASAIPAGVFSSYVYGIIRETINYDERYARARLVLSFNGGVYTVTNAFNTGLEQTAVFRGSWLPDGEDNSNYEVMFEFVSINSDNAPEFASSYLKYVTGDAMDTWHSLSSTKAIGLEAAPPTQLRGIEAGLTINVKLKHVDAPVSEAVFKQIVLSIAQEP